MDDEKIVFNALKLHCPTCQIPLHAGVDEKVPFFVLLYCSQCNQPGVKLYLTGFEPCCHDPKTLTAGLPSKYVM